MSRGLINIGHLFARPHESRYAMLRRTLTVNPGLSLDTLYKYLQEQLPEKPPFPDGIEAIQSRDATPSSLPGRAWRRSHTRQCPECARLLFHSDLYLLPWLGRCPIHHCAFTKLRPVCNRSWPDLKEVATRDCPGCGRMPIPNLRDCLTKLDTSPIELITELINKGTNNASLVAGNPYEENVFNMMWCKSISIFSRDFASSFTCLNPTWSDALLDKLEISRRPMRHKITTIQTLHRPKRPLIEFYTRPTKGMGLHSVPRLGFNGDFAVMRRIVRWIEQQVPRHRFHLLSYRNLGRSHFVQSPEVCPYCFALSLWFFLIAKKRYARYYPNISSYYPFMENGIFQGMFDIWEPYISIGNTFYKTSRAFSDWFYQRSLEISYTELLKSSFNWLSNLRETVDDTTEHSNQQKYRENHADMTYKMQIMDHEVAFIYDNEHPLDALAHIPLQNANELCASYAKHHQSNPLILEPYSYSFNSHDFNEHSFIEAHHRYLGLLMENRHNNFNSAPHH